MAQSIPNSWNDTQHQQQKPQYKSESSEQLDKLLAGLDQLSGTLPDLNNTLITHSQQQQHVSRKFPVDPAQGLTWTGSKNISASAGSITDRNCVNLSRVRGVSESRLVDKMRSYEEDLDYALEKDMVIKGPERKLLVNTDNYSEMYSDKASNMENFTNPG